MATKSHQKGQANFFISTHIIATLKETVPHRELSLFVEEAIEKELKRRQFLQALETTPGAWKKKDHPEKTETFIRSLRESQRI